MFDKKNGSLTCIAQDKGQGGSYWGKTVCSKPQKNGTWGERAKFEKSFFSEKEVERLTIVE